MNTREVNNFCVQWFGRDVLDDRTQEERNDLYKFWIAIDFLAANKVNMQINEPRYKEEEHRLDPKPNKNILPTKDNYMSTKKRFILAAALAFPGMILLFTQNSYFAEKNNIRGLYLVVGILLIVAALYQLVKANQQSNTGNQGNAR